MTVQAALTQAQAQLTQAGVDTPRLDSTLLLMWVLKARREDLAREPERPLTEREQVIWAKAVALREGRRPLAYITGEAWFYGRAFKINRAVLVPRPETEGLVQAALDVCKDVPSPRIADIGTGSGCVAVTIACERPNAEVWATDISPLALTLARKNVARHGARVTLAQGDLCGALPPGVGYHAIASNPPYVTEAERPHLQPEVRDFEPTLALSGVPGSTGTDGTALHRRLLADAPHYLLPGGWMLLEVGRGQAECVMDCARSLGYDAVQADRDGAGIARIVRARRS